MNNHEYKQQVLDKISTSFCAAKWYNATIWLGSGMTTSCHHPPAHAIGPEFKENPKAIHNTAQKKQDRKMMLAGERPSGCEYCWKIEDMNSGAVSDRVYKSKIYTLEAIHEARSTPVDQDINLRTLEIAFDRTCQYACSYCNPAFSSSWVKDIRRNGPYQQLVSDGRNHFTHVHDSAQLYDYGESNPYIDSFFAWWESDLHRTLQELRITGGEPLMSGHTWKLLDWFAKNKGRSQTRLAINTNLGVDFDVLQRLLDACEDIELDLYTSNESVDTHAEYIRDGLNMTQWQYNMVQLIETKRLRSLHVMCTINALCLETLPEFLTLLLTWKSQYGENFPNFTLNILRFPSFQSPLVLPEHLRSKYKDQLQSWLNTFENHVFLHQHERDHVQRLIDYLDIVKTPHSGAFDLQTLQKDFKSFYQQYDQRRGKNFTETFPSLKDWYESL